ncbi:glycosyltransferase family 2 protein [Candidatus Uhrbacteria bacterium]|nr:glycosyltransferase family 2 protein [Candidatus Uhrbacteria bacterium]
MNNEDLIFDTRNPNRKAEVSVVLVFNSSNYHIDIKSVLESIEGQTLKSLEIIIYDNGSNTYRLKSLRSYLSRSRQFGGGALLLNFISQRTFSQISSMTLKYATAQYILFLDDNIFLYPRCIGSLLSALKNSNASFTHCYIEIFGASRGIFNAYPWNDQSLMVGEPAEKFVLIKKAILEKSRNYSEDCLKSENYQFWSKVNAIGGDGILVPEILMRCKINSNTKYRPIESQLERTISYEYF